MLAGVAVGGADRAQQILGVQHADDVLRLVAPQRNPGVFGGQDLAHQLFRRQVGVQRHHRGPMHHHVGDREIAEPEHVLDVFGLAAFHLAVLGGFADQPLDLGVGQDLVLGVLLDPKQPQDRARGLVEQPVQRIEHDEGDVQRIGDPLRHRLRLPDRQGLGHLLADHDVQRGEQQKAAEKRDEVKRRVRQPERHQQRLEQRRDGRLADPAEPQRRHGDAELAAGEIGLDIGHHVLQQRRAEALLLHHRLDAEAAAFHQREFRRHVEGVGGQKQHRDQDVGEGRTHLALTIAGTTPSGLKGRSGPVDCDAGLTSPPASCAGNRAPARARRRWRSPRGRSPPSG